MYIEWRMNATDAELAEQALQGDHGSFEALVRQNQDAVFNLAWRMTNNWHEAADITQEAFIRAFQKLRSYKPEYPFRNWVMTIGANLTRNRFRSIARRRRVEEEQAKMIDPPLPPRTGLRDDALDQALARLPETLRVPLVLKHMEELSYDEIARMLGIGISAAKMRVARARDELVGLLTKTGEASHDEKESH